MDKITQPKEQSFFKDKNGHWAIWQWPNVPLYGWLVFELLSFVIKQEHLQAGFVYLSRAFLFTWAYLEITQGLNFFRRLLGVVVMAGVIASYFR